MTLPIAICPDANRLNQLLSGELSEAEVDTICGHLEVCPGCLQSAQSLNDSAVTQDIRASGTLPDTSKTPFIKELMYKIIHSRARAQSSGTHPSSPLMTLSISGSEPAKTDLKWSFLAPAQLPEEIGRLNGYRVLRLLGEGGMGMVFEAEDIRLKRRVALKVMKPEIAVKEQQRVRFLREAQTAAAVEHDHICPIHQVGEENGVPFIAMPFLKGEGLDQRLRKQRILPLDEALRIGCEIAEGLAAAHDAGLVHRDIKPGNVWLARREESGRSKDVKSLSQRGQTTLQPSSFQRVKILDFGLARLAADDMQLTQSGAIVGTPAYMAPEQARGKTVDHRVDLFSLGVMLYEMTTGCRPFTGGDTMAILTSLALDDPTAPHLLNPELPVEISKLIMRLLSKSPDGRPVDGHAVAEELRTIEKRIHPSTGEPVPQSTSSSRLKSDSSFSLDFSQPATALTVPRAGSPMRAAIRQSGGRKGLIAAALALLLIGGVGFGAYKLVFETKEGKLLVEVDGDTDVRFKNGKVEIFGADGQLKYTLQPGERVKDLPRGQYSVAVVGADGVKLDTDKFEMNKDGKVVVRVIAEGGVAKETPNTKNPDPAIPAIPFVTLDKLDPTLISADERFPWQPKDLVAVLGEHSGRHWGQIRSLGFSPDGKRIVCSGPVGKTQIFDAATLREQHVLMDTRITASAWSPIGHTLVTTATDHEDSGLWLWDMSGAVPKRQGKLATDVNIISISSDGRFLAGCRMHQGREVRLWDLTSPQPKELPRIKDLKNGINCLAISPDGSSLAVGIEKEGLKLWSLKGGMSKDLPGITLPADVTHTCFSPDNTTLVIRNSAPAGGEPAITLWDLKGGTPKRQSTLAPQNTAGFAFSPNSKTLYCASWTDVLGYDVTTAIPVEKVKFKVESNIMSLALAPDGKTLVVGLENGLLRVWDLSGNQAEERLPDRSRLEQATLASDGKTFAAGDFKGNVHLWDVTGAKPIARAGMDGRDGSVVAVAFSPDCKLLASTCASEIRLWDLTKAIPEEHTHFRPGGFSRTTVFSPDGKKLIFRNQKGNAVWDITSLEPKELTFLPGSGEPMALSPDGKTLACYSEKGKLVLWDLATSQLRELFTPEHAGGPTAVVWAGDGKSLAATYDYFHSHMDIMLWDLREAKEKYRTFNVLGLSPGNGADFSPDGTALAVSSASGEVNILRVRDMKPLQKWQFAGPVHRVVFAPDGHHLITTNGNGTAYVLRLKPVP